MAENRNTEDVMIDLHIHILPGLDDGPSNMAESLAMCRLAVADGVRTIVATPHMLNGMFDVSRTSILAGVRKLQDSLDIEGIPLTVFPGADIHIEKDLCNLLKDGTVVTVGDLGKYVMVEMASDVLPWGLSKFLFDIQLTGVTPIISHPERNYEVQQDPSMMSEFVDAGNLVQLTAASIAGGFGSAAKQCAHTLLRMRLAHVVASDAHSFKGRPAGLSKARSVGEEILSFDEAEEMFVQRPAKILAGEYVDVPERTQEKKIGRKRWFSW